DCTSTSLQIESTTRIHCSCIHITLRLLDALQNDINRLPLYFSGNARQPYTAIVFFKGLVCLTIIKMGALWTVSHTVMTYHEASLPASIPGKLLLAPTLLADWNVDVFYVLSFAFLFVALFIRSNYVV